MQCIVLCLFCILIVAVRGKDVSDLLVVTVATHETDGFKRFLRSAKAYDLDVEVLGMGQNWEGGDIKRYPGGAQKINIMKASLAKYKDDKDTVLLFTDGFDVVFTGPKEEILKVFTEYKARVLFSAESACWPDESLAPLYPKVERGKPYLNSGGFIGYASDIYEIISKQPVQNDDDDQLYYTKIYLDEKLRDKHSIRLDHLSKIFQNLNGAAADVELQFKGKEAFVQNTLYNTVPLVIHGNGPSKTLLNTYGNYLAKSWNPEDGCLSCQENMIEFDDRQESDSFKVTLGIFITQPTPFMDEFLNKILALNYPKQKMSLFIHNAAAYHDTMVSNFVDMNKKHYASIEVIPSGDNVKEWHARNMGLKACVTNKCDYYLSVDSVVHLDNPHSLKLLIEQNRPVLAPMLLRPYKAWSNFWGALTSDGFYARSVDYMDIIQSNRRGVWNVPYISGAYLIQGALLRDKSRAPSFIFNLLDADMALCHNLREKDVFMYVTNRLDWGHLIDAENFETNHLHNELFELINNRWDWEQRYIHKNYTAVLAADFVNEQPCPDVFRFPIVTERYCDELVEEMEHFGEWSDGGHKDRRLEGGYESVPTRDIHLRQIGLETVWLDFLEHYVAPLQAKVYEGYENLPPNALLNFVVRYRPDEQHSLRPHHDSSTYTINIALNNPLKDFEGGGCRFVRYNCSVVDSSKGWMLMHPGRLTHYHEGLRVTKGTRYIMVSFVDP